MADPVTNQTPKLLPPAGGTTSTASNLTSRLLSEAAKLIGTEIAAAALGPQAATMLSTLQRILAEGSDPSDAKIKGSAKRLASAFMLDAAARYEPAKAPAVSDASLSKLDPKLPVTAAIPNEAGLYQLVTKPGHLVSVLLQELGVPAKLTARVASVLDSARNNIKLQDLTNPAAYANLGRELAKAAIEDGITAVFPKVLSGAKAELEPVKSEAIALPDRTAEAPKGDITGAKQNGSSTRARKSAGVNPMATLLMNRTRNADAAEAKLTPQQLTGEIAKALGVPVSDPRMAAVQKAVERALVFTPEGRLDSAASVENAFRALSKAAPGVAGYKTAKDAAELICATFREQGKGVHDLSPSLSESLAKLTAYALTRHAAVLLGKHDELKDDKSWFVMDRIASTLVNSDAMNTMHERRTTSAADRAPKAKKAAPEERGQLFHSTNEMLAKALAPLNSGNPKAAAAEMATMFGNALRNSRPDLTVDMPKIAKVFEDILSKGMGSAMEIATQALGYYAEHVGMPPEQFQKLMVEVGELGARVGEGESTLLALDHLVKTLPEKKAQATERLEGLKKELAEHTAKGLTDSVESTKKEIAAAEKELAKLAEDEKRLPEDHKKLQGNLAADREDLANVTANYLLFNAMYACDPEAEKAKFQDGGGGGGGPKGPKGPDGPDGPFRDGPQGSGKPNGSLARRRYEACAAVLADPSLSVQDKVFLFMMIFVSFMDLEREDKLKEVIKQDEAQALREEQRDNLRRERAGDEKMVQDLAGQVDGARKELADLKGAGLADDHPQVKAAQDKLENKTRQHTVANEKCQKKADEYDKLLRESDQAPRSREVIFMELERLDQIRSQIFNMARNLIEESNKLIERIFR